MNAKYKVTLNRDERFALEKLTSSGKHSSRRIKRAQILLLDNNKTYDDQKISDILSVSLSTVYRVKRDFVEYGLEEVLQEGVRPGQPRKLNVHQEALLVAIACSKPPKGRCRWTLSLLGDQLVALSDIVNISHETICHRLKENDLKPWQKKMWCIANLDAAFIARMEAEIEIGNMNQQLINYCVIFNQNCLEVSLRYDRVLTLIFFKLCVDELELFFNMSLLSDIIHINKNNISFRHRKYLLIINIV